MTSGVFVIQKDGSLVEMHQSDYDSEEILQELLAQYPNLLAGNLIDDNNPRKWLLISREYGIPDKNESYDRWSLDHLFLDQDGIPTLVEVKRSSDTRIRREVVGQLLEYAANAVQYWDVPRIIASYEARCSKGELDPRQELVQRLNVEDYDEYWNSVKTNLEIAKIRLLFIADEIPLELRQIVEFLNEQMNNVEVLALEIKQYAGPEQRTLIPRLFGQSTKTQTRKRSREGREWDETSFLEELLKNTGSEEVETAKILIEWGKEKNLRLWWGKGAIQGSCYFQLDHKDKVHYSFALWTSNRIEIQFHYLANRPVYDSEEKREEIRTKLNDIEGVNLGKNTLTKLPNFPITLLNEQKNLKKFLEIWEKYIDEIRIA